MEILSYLNGTISLGITYVRGSGLELEVRMRMPTRLMIGRCNSSHSLFPFSVSFDKRAKTFIAHLSEAVEPLTLKAISMVLFQYQEPPTILVTIQRMLQNEAMGSTNKRTKEQRQDGAKSHRVCDHLTKEGKHRTQSTHNRTSHH